MKTIPSGNVTFLFTDIEASTKLAQDFPNTLQAALEKHHAIMQKAIESNNGFVFEIVGDAFCCTFENASDTVKAAVDAHLELAKVKWSDAVIKVRMGIHSGNAEWNGKRYMGYITLAKSARVMSTAYGGQILISNDAYELVKDKFTVSNQLASRSGEIGNERFTNDISFRDLGERRLKDVIQPIRLFQIISHKLRQDFPPLNTLDVRPNNLPVQLTSFIGREEEMKNVKSLLKQTHLLTLTGSGGSGKTRLALQVAADVIDDFISGVWLVDLASLFEPTLLQQAIIKVFGLMEGPKRPLEEILYNYLRGKEILIILDNCEHLIEACSKLTEKLLNNCPKLKIIATSREALRCEGEQTHRVLSLEIPDPKDKNSPEKLSQYEAVRLFIERALSVDSTFRVNNDNAPALAQICYQLDGIPLAIELAAARTKVLSIEKICERLSNRFNLLTGGKRTSLPRQQTLRALIDWSYDLLSEKEKILWRRLSVFAGGWTLEAVEEVCSDEKMEKEEVLELLHQLTEKSIIVFEKEKERYRILKTLKQYGEVKLREANEVEEILSRHLYYFMEFSETVEPKLEGSEIQIWLEKLEEDHGNFQSAIEWSIRSGDREEGARLAGSLGYFWKVRGHYSTGRRLLESILDNAQGVGRISRAKTLYSLGSIVTLLGEYERARKILEESLALSREMGEKRGIAYALNSLGNAAADLGNYEQAQKFYEESLILRREMRDKRGIAFSLNNLGNVAYNQGNYEQAENFFEESLVLSREMGEKRGIAIFLSNLGNVAHFRGNHEQAQKFIEESLALSRDMGEKTGIAESLNTLGDFAYNQGYYEQAKKFYEESLTLRLEMGEKIGIADSLNNLGTIAYRQENYGQAMIFFEESLTLRREIGDKSAIAVCVIGFAGVLLAGNHLYRAVMLLGAVEATLKFIGKVLDRDDQKFQEQIINRLHEKLSKEEFSKYWEEGKQLTLEQAAGLALSNEQ